ncbi:MAG: hypothetical protein QOE05_966 [Actinomycetota bacterium]|nr:hypothetical protein [Actinomycetota bacterium]
MVTADPAGRATRIVVTAGATAAGIVLLFSYSTSTSGSVPTQALAPAAVVPGALTYDGAVAQTQWGPVQVRIAVKAGKVVSASTVQVPANNRRDQEINGYAVPILNAEAVRAGSAQIDTVSGATVTSVGYITSLQAAVDAAGLS